jgi:hypothetical protein
MHRKSSCLVSHIRLSESLTSYSSRAQFIIPSEESLLISHSEDDERAMAFGPIAHLRIRTVSQQKHRNCMTRLHCALRQREIAPGEYEEFSLRHHHPPFSPRD